MCALRAHIPSEGPRSLSLGHLPLTGIAQARSDLSPAETVYTRVSATQ
jgi:hypothetical protein